MMGIQQSFLKMDTENADDHDNHSVDSQQSQDARPTVKDVIKKLPKDSVNNALYELLMEKNQRKRSATVGGEPECDMASSLSVAAHVNNLIKLHTEESNKNSSPPNNNQTSLQLSPSHDHSHPSTASSDEQMSAATMKPLPTQTTSSTITSSTSANIPSQTKYESQQHPPCAKNQTPPSIAFNPKKRFRMRFEDSNQQNKKEEDGLQNASSTQSHNSGGESITMDRESVNEKVSQPSVVDSKCSSERIASPEHSSQLNASTGKCLIAKDAQSASGSGDNIISMRSYMDEMMIRMVKAPLTDLEHSTKMSMMKSERASPSSHTAASSTISTNATSSGKESLEIKAPPHSSSPVLPHRKIMTQNDLIQQKIREMLRDDNESNVPDIKDSVKSSGNSSENKPLINSLVSPSSTPPKGEVDSTLNGITPLTLIIAQIEAVMRQQPCSLNSLMSQRKGTDSSSDVISASTNTAVVAGGSSAKSSGTSYPQLRMQLQGGSRGSPYTRLAGGSITKGTVLKTDPKILAAKKKYPDTVYRIVTNEIKDRVYNNTETNKDEDNPSLAVPHEMRQSRSHSWSYNKTGKVYDKQTYLNNILKPGPEREHRETKHWDSYLGIQDRSGTPNDRPASYHGDQPQDATSSQKPNLTHRRPSFNQSLKDDYFEKQNHLIKLLSERQAQSEENQKQTESTVYPPKSHRPVKANSSDFANNFSKHPSRPSSASHHENSNSMLSPHLNPHSVLHRTPSSSPYLIPSSSSSLSHRHASNPSPHLTSHHYVSSHSPHPQHHMTTPSTVIPSVKLSPHQPYHPSSSADYTAEAHKALSFSRGGDKERLYQAHSNLQIHGHREEEYNIRGPEQVHSVPDGRRSREHLYEGSNLEGKQSLPGFKSDPQRMTPSHGGSITAGTPRTAPVDKQRESILSEAYQIQSRMPRGGQFPHNESGFDANNDRRGSPHHSPKKLGPLHVSSPPPLMPIGTESYAIRDNTSLHQKPVISGQRRTLPEQERSRSRSPISSQDRYSNYPQQYQRCVNVSEPTRRNVSEIPLDLSNKQEEKYNVPHLTGSSLTSPVLHKHQRAPTSPVLHQQQAPTSPALQQRAPTSPVLHQRAGGGDKQSSRNQQGQRLSPPQISPSDSFVRYSNPPPLEKVYQEEWLKHYRLPPQVEKQLIKESVVPPEWKRTHTPPNKKTFQLEKPIVGIDQQPPAVPTHSLTPHSEQNQQAINTADLRAQMAARYHSYGMLYPLPVNTNAMYSVQHPHSYQHVQDTFSKTNTFAEHLYNTSAALTTAVKPEQISPKKLIGIDSDQISRVRSSANIKPTHSDRNTVYPFESDKVDDSLSDEILSVKCNLCGNEWQNMEGFIRHFKFEHANEGEPLQHHITVKSFRKTKQEKDTELELQTNSQQRNNIKKEEVQGRPKDNESVMKCFHCDQKFPTRDWGMFRRHMKSHEIPPTQQQVVVQEKISCAECHVIFKDKNEWQLHMSLCHKNHACVCKVCNVGFAHIDAMYKHLHTAHSGLTNVEVEFCCLHCNKSFSNERDLSEHREIHNHQGRGSPGAHVSMSVKPRVRDQEVSMSPPDVVQRLTPDTTCKEETRLPGSDPEMAISHCNSSPQETMATYTSSSTRPALYGEYQHQNNTKTFFEMLQQKVEDEHRRQVTSPKGDLKNRSGIHKEMPKTKVAMEASDDKLFSLKRRIFSDLITNEASANPAGGKFAKFDKTQDGSRPRQDVLLSADTIISSLVESALSESNNSTKCNEGKGNPPDKIKTLMSSLLSLPYVATTTNNMKNIKSLVPSQSNNIGNAVNKFGNIPENVKELPVSNADKTGQASQGYSNETVLQDHCVPIDQSYETNCKPINERTSPIQSSKGSSLNGNPQNYMRKSVQMREDLKSPVSSQLVTNSNFNPHTVNKSQFTDSDLIAATVLAGISGSMAAQPDNRMQHRQQAINCESTSNDDENTSQDSDCLQTVENELEQRSAYKRDENSCQTSDKTSTEKGVGRKSPFINRADNLESNNIVTVVMKSDDQYDSEKEIDVQNSPRSSSGTIDDQDIDVDNMDDVKPGSNSDAASNLYMNIKQNEQKIGEETDTECNNSNIHNLSNGDTDNGEEGAINSNRTKQIEESVNAKKTAGQEFDRCYSFDDDSPLVIDEEKNEESN